MRIDLFTIGMLLWSALAPTACLVGAEPDLTGQWVGGIQRSDTWDFLTTTLERRDNLIQGTLSSGFFIWKQDAEISNWRFNDETSRVTFTSGLVDNRRSFEGVYKNGTIQGVVEENSKKTSFHLTRLTPINAEEYFGIYEVAPGHPISIGRSVTLGVPNTLILIDFKTGRFAMLLPKDEKTFFAGPSVLVTVPEDIVLEFDLDSEDTATGFRIRNRDGSSVYARRISVEERELVFKNGEVSLSGSLMLPQSEGPHPSIVVIPPSTGYATREMARPFLEFFAYHGIATFAYDKRGTGKSEGDWLKADFPTLAEDALAALRLLQDREEIDAKNVGLMGSSQSGWIAPLAASRSQDVDFIVSISGPGVTPEVQELHRTESWLRADGFAESDIAEAMAVARLRNQAARTDTGWDKVRESDESIKNRTWHGYVGASGGKDNPFWAFWNLIRDYDPVPALESVKCPVLAMFGELDTYLPVEISAEIWETSLRRAENTDFTIKVFPHADHGLTEAKTGGLKEIPYTKRFVPGYFSLLRDWVLERARK